MMSCFLHLEPFLEMPLLQWREEYTTYAMAGKGSSVESMERMAAGTCTSTANRRRSMVRAPKAPHMQLPGYYSTR